MAGKPGQLEHAEAVELIWIVAQDPLLELFRDRLLIVAFSKLTVSADSG